MSDPGKADALRAAFCLPPGQALLGHFLCARRKTSGWESGIYMQVRWGGCASLLASWLVDRFADQWLGDRHLHAGALGRVCSCVG